MLRIPHCVDNRLTVHCEILFTERERERIFLGGRVVRDTTNSSGGSEVTVAVQKVPRHSPLVLLVRVELCFSVRYNNWTWVLGDGGNLVRNLNIKSIGRAAWEACRATWNVGTNSAFVYCENHTEHTDTVRTSQETHYVSSTEPNRLMLFGETVAVYCENHTEHKVPSASLCP
jgi:hypothetical protein